MLGPVNMIVLDFYKIYEVWLGQIHPSFRRIVILLHQFVNNMEDPHFTIDHLLRI